MNTGIIILVIVVILLLAIASMYNGLIRLKVQVEEAYADIDVQLKRRYDLIPNLVESVKGYAKHEKELFEKVTEARAAAVSAPTDDIKAKSEAENMLTGALRSVFAVAENYPDLKASENFKQLSTELTDTENKLEAARRFYNANVRDFNTKVQIFPTNIFARMLGFTVKEMFEVENAAEKEAVKVSF